MTDKTYTYVENEDQVTDEIIDIVWEIVNGWYRNSRIDWEDIFYRAEGSTLEDGTILDFGNSAISPAIKKIKSEIRRIRQQS